MLELQLPRPMPHALPREPPFDFYASSSRSMSKLDSTMQLPMPRMATGHDHVQRAPLTPPRPSRLGQVLAISMVTNYPPSETRGLWLLHEAPVRNARPSSRHKNVTHTPRKKWSISPNLRIPPTISTPQEGLPQLADEPLVPDAHPTIGFKKWVATILTTTQVAQNGKPGSEYRLLTVALMLGNKFLDDNTYTNKTWAEVSGISVQEVHIMEVEFLSNMRYSLFTSKERWEEWHTVLGKFGTFFDKASRIPASGTISPVGPPTPSLAVPHNFVPSPPTAQQTSPPTAMMYSPNHAAFSNTPLLQPQATSTTVSPIGSLPELGPIVRKRSADYGAEQSFKRQAHGFAPGPYGNAPPIPTLQTPVNRSFEVPPSVNRLPPLPSLSIPAPQPMQPAQGKNWSELPLPGPGARSMAMVYPPPVQWQQPIGTPTSMPAPPFSNNYTPTSSSRQMSPYPPSAGSSPYQPLGRPNTERRAGLLPYMDRNAWPETNQFNQLPIPQQPIFR
ncbi:hypothetical protein SNOG_16094 [Parastagonospora nodorum SN15]|uniref:Cyclin-like domain-containing protein n=1 Tax=Phaeosphaeria nodorum (strain SN15 / ATCC MYA-4574 / FGSC 10173) TaxID=321614 RepID=Q0TWG3_PHANO|nr:hypothetical protein SNOG_16094 [Parastagonospora nodorum SN15]EAT76466.2 hypothetical protein SNOG_16094 [Parastagonospora nodorum SN15]